jgi:cytochrome c553
MPMLSAVRGTLKSPSIRSVAVQGSHQLVLLLLFVASGTAQADAPEWAFLSCSSGGAQAPVKDTESLPGSSRQFAHASIVERGSAIDWFPQSHEPLPAVVAEPRGPGQAACGYCHLPDGTGRPENAKLAGLPQAYIISVRIPVMADS